MKRQGLLQRHSTHAWVLFIELHVSIDGVHATGTQCEHGQFEAGAARNQEHNRGRVPALSSVLRARAADIKYYGGAGPGCRVPEAQGDAGDTLIPNPSLARARS